MKAGQRILVLTEAESFAEAEDMIRCAREEALFPALVSFGLCLEREPEAEDREKMPALGSIRWLIDGEDPRRAMTRLWQGEEWVLSANIHLSFRRGWDMRCVTELHRMERSGIRHALLTCWPAQVGDWRGGSLPVAGKEITENGELVCGPGMPLRYAVSAQRSALIHPRCCFAPSAFFRQMAETDEILYLAAFRAGWRPYTPHVPVLETVAETDEVVYPKAEGEDSLDWLKRLDRLYDTKLSEGKITACLRQGVHTADLSFNKRVPAAELLRGKADGLRRRNSRVQALFVTLFPGKPEGTETMEEDGAFFRMLSEIKKLALLCYAPPAFMRQAELKVPGVAEFQEGHLIRTRRPPRADEAEDRLKASKAQLLLRSREKVPGVTHRIWIDHDILRWPVAPETEIRAERVCQDRIVLGMIAGEPDPCMIAVPDELLERLCQAIATICEAGYPEEKTLWKHLMAEHGDWFRPVQVSEKRELFSLPVKP